MIDRSEDGAPRGSHHITAINKGDTMVIYTTSTTSKRHTPTRGRWLMATRHRCCRNATRIQSNTATADRSRMLVTDLVNNGLPIHIGAALLGHLNLQTTREYVAVFNEDVVRPLPRIPRPSTTGAVSG